MNNSLSNRRSATKNNDMGFGQHKRGTNTAASRNSLANIIKQNEVKNIKSHNKENYFYNNHSVSNGTKSISQDESIQQTTDDRALHAVNQNLKNFSINAEPSSQSSVSPKSREAEYNSIPKMNQDNSLSVNGTQDSPNIEEETVSSKANGGNEELANGAEVENGNENNDTKSIENEPKHPLHHSWSFWYFKNDRSRDWTDNLMKIHDVDTVEDFWAVYMHLEDVSKIGAGCDYALFKTGIMPTWEDKENESGGRWLIQFDAKQRHRGLDYYWREVLMYLIGNTAENDIINGAVVNVRHKQDKISLWLSTSGRQDESQILNTGKQLKSRLDITDMTINFEIHKESQTKKSSMSKFAFTL